MADVNPGYVAPESSEYEGLVKQIQIEYLLCYDGQKDKIERNLNRLKLYNNQMRDPNAVGDPLLFTVHQTVLASLYDDKLASRFEGTEQGDEETSENLNALAKYDYRLMRKEELDYYWLWDTLFFSRSIVKLYEFDRSKKRMCPIPELIDPMTFLHDPKAAGVHGDIRGLNGMRFGGREIEIPRRNITAEKGFINFDNLTPGTEVKSLTKRARQLRDEASGLNTFKHADESDLGDSEMISCLEWYTYYKGKPVMVVLSNNRNNVIKFKELKDRFPLIDRPMYPHSHDWDGTSIPDLVEDKQRQRAVAINLGIQAMKADLYPMYLYDEGMIKNKSDLQNFAFNKFIGVDAKGKGVGNAALPLNKANPSYQMSNWILQTLDASAQKATATPDMQQGQISSQQRTLGELNLVSTNVDTRYSLTAKVFGWSETRFWEFWYDLYKSDFKKGIDKKVVRIAGAMGTKWRELTAENFIMEQDPDVFVESRKVAETELLKNRITLNQYGVNILNSPNAIGKKYFERKLAKINGLDDDEINIIYPKSVDEMIAEDENDQLSEDIMVQVNPNDNDYEHIQIHSKAADTKARYGHIAGHKAQIMMKRTNPEIFSPEALPGNNVAQKPQDQQSPEAPNIGVTKPSGIVSSQISTGGGA